LKIKRRKRKNMAGPSLKEFRKVGPSSRFLKRNLSPMDPN
jgi:hypothetical protein